MFHLSIFIRSSTPPPGPCAPRARPAGNRKSPRSTARRAPGHGDNARRQAAPGTAIWSPPASPARRCPGRSGRQSRQMLAASIRNCSRMVRRLAPMALRTPISRVRSTTDTNMMFMMPMPPTNSARLVTNRPMMAMVGGLRMKPFDDLVLLVDGEIVGLVRAADGGSRRITWRNSSWASSRRAKPPTHRWEDCHRSRGR